MRGKKASGALRREPRAVRDGLPAPVRRAARGSRPLLVGAALLVPALGLAGAVHGQDGDGHGGETGNALRSGSSIQLGNGQGRVGPPREVPPAHRVRSGDTLWDITGRYFGNPWMWPRVWSYNPEITNPHWIYPDGVVRLRAGDGTPTVEEARLPTGSEGIRVARAEGPRAPGAVLLREEGFVDTDALERAGRITGSPEEHMLLATYDEVYLEFEEGDDDDDAENPPPPVTPGQELSVFRRIEQDEREAGESGELVRILGAVRVRAYDPERRVATAVIVDTLDPIERGFEVADIPRRFELVPPRRADIDLEAEVIASLRPRQMLGEYQVLFVDVGEEEGVRLGNRFVILRSADEWRASLDAREDRLAATAPNTPRISDPPDEVIGEARVVTVRSHASGLMVTNSTRPVVIGDRAEMRSGY